MNNFFKLIYNELTKTYIRKSTWVMYIFLAILIIGFAGISKAFDEHSRPLTYGDDWQEELAIENEKLLEEQTENDKAIEEYEAKEAAGKEMDDDIYFDIYYNGPDMNVYEENLIYLKEDKKPSGYGAWRFVSSNAGLLSVVSLMTIIIAAGIVANEFRWGTIKVLLIRPISRTRILLSKYITVLLFALISLLFVFGFAWIIGAIFFGVEGIKPFMIVTTYTNDLEEIRKTVPIFKEVISAYGYGMVNLVMMSTFAFMISAAFRNSSLAVGTGIALMMGGNAIVLLLSEYKFTKFILFANTNLKQYADDNPMIEGMTLGFSVTMLIIYFVLFTGLAWTVFVKRDVA